MQQYDVIAVLGYGFLDNWNLPPHVYKRLEQVAKLYHKGLSSKIALCGKWSINWDKKHITPPTTEAEAMKHILFQKGILEKDILTEEHSQDTIGNAYYLKTQIVKPYHFHKIHIFCADFVEKRVKFLFEKIFGPTYQLTFTPTTTPFGKDKRVALSQHEVLFAQKKFLADMKDGDEAYLDNRLYDDAYYKQSSDPIAAKLAQGTL